MYKPFFIESMFFSHFAISNQDTAVVSHIVLMKNLINNRMVILQPSAKYSFIILVCFELLCEMIFRFKAWNFR